MNAHLKPLDRSIQPTVRHIGDDDDDDHKDYYGDDDHDMN